MWNPKNDTNEIIYKTEIDTENKLMVTKGERNKLEFEINRYRLLYIK